MKCEPTACSLHVCSLQWKLTLSAIHNWSLLTDPSECHPSLIDEKSGRQCSWAVSMCPSLLANTASAWRRRQRANVTGTSVTVHTFRLTNTHSHALYSDSTQSNRYECKSERSTEISSSRWVLRLHDLWQTEKQGLRRSQGSGAPAISHWISKLQQATLVPNHLRQISWGHTEAHVHKHTHRVSLAENKAVLSGLEKILTTLGYLL